MSEYEYEGVDFVNLVVDDEFKALIPPLTQEEYTQLEANLLAEGCRDPIVAWRVHYDTIYCTECRADRPVSLGDGRWVCDFCDFGCRPNDYCILDGHNRYDICMRHNIPFDIVTLHDYRPGSDGVSRQEALVWILRNQLGRRNLCDLDRVALALKLKPLLAEEAKQRQRKAGHVYGEGHPQGIDNTTKELSVNLPKALEPTDTRAEIARLSGVSEKTVSKIETILDYASPPLVHAIRENKASISAAADIATLPQSQQEEIVARGEKEILVAAKRIRAERQEDRRHERMERLGDIARGSTPLLTAVRYPIIYADPPWRYDYVETESRAIENQYPTMPLEDICALPLDGVTTDDAVLFLWVTSPKLAEALRVIEAWGFNYRTSMVWVKDHIGMGYYARQQHEFLLICTKGAPPTPAPGDRPASVIHAPRLAHSAKPDEFYTLIEQMYPTLPKIELFSRSPRAGWVAWGNQV